jgi:Domain of unknown function (DUF3883)
MRPKLVKAVIRIGGCGKNKGRNVPGGPYPHLAARFLLRRGAGFGEAERNALVELAAVNAVTIDYRSHGWRVKSREREKSGPGYDLLCARGSAVDHVEVKGISGPDCTFVVTANEKEQARRDPLFWLVAVTHALDARRRQLAKFTGPELLRKFHFVPIRFVARPR